MKRYISAILIPCLLMQLCGCYSQRNVTYGELTSAKADEISIEINDSLKYFLKKNLTTKEIVMHPETNYCFNVDTSINKLIFFTRAVGKTPGQNLSIIEDTLEISRSYVRSIHKTEIDGASTLILSMGIIVGAALIGLIIVVNEMPY